MADAVLAALQGAVADGCAPGVAAALVERGRGVTRQWCVGALAADDAIDGPHRVTPETVFDLASLTKMLVTTVLVADAVDDGVIALDEAPWPRWPGVTVRHALAHDGGLVAHRPFFADLLHDPRRNLWVGRRRGGVEVEGAVLGTLPERPPGERVVYSDLGFIAMGALVQSRRGANLDVMWAQHALGQGTGARFVCLEDDGYHPALPLVAPTEHCPWRKRVVQGQVHDDNAFAMGGVAGHAGLFGSLTDVVTIAARLLDQLVDDSDGRESTLWRWARIRTTASPARALGFDVATAGGSTGDALSPRTVGHLGFTGTSLWFDLDADRAYVLLSNAVHGGRDGVRERNRALRVAFHRAAACV
jgi:CubicO group peptidase (beta-lactamase class C family)